MGLLFVWKPGTRVRIGGDIPGIVTQVCIRGESSLTVQYLVAWWDGRRRVSEWVDPIEITPAISEGQESDRLHVEPIEG